MIEALIPEALVAVEPVSGFLHGPGLQPAGDGAAVLLADDEARLGEDADVLHHRRQGHRERFGQFADRNGVGFAHPRQQGPACRVGQSGEGAVEARG